MSGAGRVLIILGAVFLLVVFGAMVYLYRGALQEREQIATNLSVLSTGNSVLETQVDHLEEWNSYQSTQIGTQQMMLQGLLVDSTKFYTDTPFPTFTQTPYISPTITPTRYSSPTTPPTPTPDRCGESENVFASEEAPPGVVIADGICCAGGPANSTISIDVQFFPDQKIASGQAIEMRVVTNYGGMWGVLERIVYEPWIPVETERTFSVHTSTNWVGYWVFVQFRAEDCSVSSIYWDDISVEGMAGTGTP